MRAMVVILGLLAAPVWAQDWVSLTGAEIQAALEDKGLVYADATQHFYASGRTLYNAGRDSWGYWAVRGDQYCSSWPPGEDWGCYDMQRAGEVLRFVAGDGSATEGRYAE